MKQSKLDQQLYFTKLCIMFYLNTLLLINLKSVTINWKPLNGNSHVKIILNAKTLFRSLVQGRKICFPTKIYFGSYHKDDFSVYSIYVLKQTRRISEHDLPVKPTQRFNGALPSYFGVFKSAYVISANDGLQHQCKCCFSRKSVFQGVQTQCLELYSCKQAHRTGHECLG